MSVSNECKFACPVNKITLTEAIEIINCTHEAVIKAYEKGRTEACKCEICGCTITGILCSDCANSVDNVRELK